MEQSNSLLQTSRWLERLRSVGVIIGVVIIAGVIGGYWRDEKVTTSLLASTLRQSTPLVLGALCGTISGVIVYSSGRQRFDVFVERVGKECPGFEKE